MNKYEKFYNAYGFKLNDKVTLNDTTDVYILGEDGIYDEKTLEYLGDHEYYLIISEDYKLNKIKERLIPKKGESFYFNDFDIICTWYNDNDIITALIVSTCNLPLYPTLEEAEENRENDLVKLKELKNKLMEKL